jgi:ABC-type sugar transport system substrate-binding protein
VNIAFVPKASDNPVFRVAYAGAQHAADELNSVVGGPRVEVNCVSPQHLDSRQQRAAVDQAINGQPSGLIVSCLDPNVITPAIDNADANGIPVITFDSDCTYSNRIAFYGMNNEKSGSTAADLLVGAMAATEGPKQKSVAIVTGGASAENLKDRVRGFNEQLGSVYPEVQVIHTSSCDETAGACGGVIEGVITAYPDLDGLFITGLWGLQAGCSCDEKTGLSCNCSDSLMPNWKAAAKRKLKTVSYDTLPFELELMQERYLSALISQDYFGWGHETVTLMFKRLTEGQKVGNFVDSEFGQVYPKDVLPLLSSWQAGELGPELTSVCATPKPP